MQEFLIRLLIVVLVIWLVDKILVLLELKEPIPKVIMVITMVVSVLWLLFGYTFLPLR